MKIVDVLDVWDPDQVAANVPEFDACRCRLEQNPSRVPRLMDAVDPGLVDQAQAALLEVPGVHSVADLKLRWIGHTLKAEAAVRVDPALSVTAGHEMAHLAESQL